MTFNSGLRTWWSLIFIAPVRWYGIWQSAQATPERACTPWLKDGFILIDKLPVNLGPLNALMEYATIRVGHFEINYGDAHFRRSDNGSAMFNPFVGNYIMDAFTTEIGGEV